MKRPYVGQLVISPSDPSVGINDIRGYVVGKILTATIFQETNGGKLWAFFAADAHYAHAEDGLRRTWVITQDDVLELADYAENERQNYERKTLTGTPKKFS